MTLVGKWGDVPHFFSIFDDAKDRAEKIAMFLKDFKDGFNEGDSFLDTGGCKDKVKDRKRLIGCNIYVTACSYDEHYPIIIELAKRAQKAFLEKSGEGNVTPSSTNLQEGEEPPAEDPSSKYEVGALVHAYADKVYNRSSFYLAGTSGIVKEVAVDLIKHAVWELRKIDTLPDPYLPATAIPDVGWVDHVCVMPLITGIEARYLSNDRSEFTCQWTETRHADVARQIGKEMQEKLGVEVFYYGMAQKRKSPLMKVWKRRQVMFKKKFPISLESLSDTGENPFAETALVGAPEEFVEQYNIRLKNRSKRRMAHYVARYVREQDHGLEGVDAYGYPYSLDRWEVMCSIQKPFAGGASVEDIKSLMRSWNQYKDFVEQGYRVGTTQEQSFQVLAEVMKGTRNREKHDLEVLDAFDRFLQISDYEKIRTE